ncbi:MAG: aminodeoxychorismate synthase component I [Pirellulaceae bacterium]
MSLPLVEELIPAPDPVTVFRKLAKRRRCLFLDSALRHSSLGRYSFVTADPFDELTLAVDVGDPLEQLAARLEPYHTDSLPALPPFQGGAAGLLGYELGRSFERLPSPRFDEFGTPALSLGLYDVVVAFDHQAERAWLVSQGFPALNARLRERRARERLHLFRAWLTEANDAAAEVCTPPLAARPITVESLAPQFPVDRFPGLSSNFSEAAYLEAVQRAVEYVHAGDVFQVNLTQRLLHPASDNPIALYLRLRERNPATFAGYYDLGEFQIVSASPERFVQVRERQVETRPIKGTRQRMARPEADLFAADDLQQSEKDRAENVMIVDLMRNDLSRVCRPDSVRVTQLCKLEAYQYVQHLVSAVEGTLADGRQPLDLIRAAFPGGSITGAPKVRAMEIIAELEPTARGPYCGSLGYLGFDGSLDLSILIRTITAGRGWWQLPVGGGIVAQSDPRSEYEETWHKATGLVRALRG